jgi:hypothetical protein
MMATTLCSSLRLQKSLAEVLGWIRTVDQTRFGVVFLIEDPLGQDPFHSPSGDDDEDSEVFPAGTKGQERLSHTIRTDGQN